MMLPLIAFTLLTSPAQDRRLEELLTRLGSRILVWGGSTLDDEKWVASNGGASFDLEAHRWEPIPPAPLEGGFDFASHVLDGKLYLWGGYYGNTSFARGAAYDPAAGTWKRMADFPLAPRGGPNTAWAGDRLFVWSGTKPGDPSDPGLRVPDGAVYHARTDAWSRLDLSGIPGGAPTLMASFGDSLLVWTSSVSEWKQVNPGEYTWVDVPSRKAVVWRAGTPEVLDASPFLSSASPVPAWVEPKLVLWVPGTRRAHILDVSR